MALLDSNSNFTQYIRQSFQMNSHRPNFFRWPASVQQL